MLEQLKSLTKYKWISIGDKEPNQKIFEMLVQASGIPLITRETMRFKNYDLTKGDKEAYIFAMSMADINEKGIWVYSSDELSNSWDRKTKILTLFSNTGRGKTHLAIATGWELLDSYLRLNYDNYDDIEQNCTVIYRQVNSLMNELRNGYEKNNFNDILNDCKICRLLILDDLGAEKSTDWTWATLDEIIDWRYINQLDTIVTTNVTSSKLSPRIASRLLDTHISKIITLKNEDYRRLN